MPYDGKLCHMPNPCLAALGQGLFLAFPIWPADAGSSTGLATGADGRVLDSADRVIDGLFAVGNDMASPMQGTYPGPGITLGLYVTFGNRSACFAASLCAP
ncbi:MAG: FAD-binding protein [Hydrogenophaga sp.]|nr:FAD-binding protein [Hydrogenophaga sp.]MDO9570609.1 FAD-binding protein [Hydrogenophaga sp.]MDP3376308.1 FAD-binding protein [Hydrogenophaga sp.]